MVTLLFLERKSYLFIYISANTTKWSEKEVRIHNAGLADGSFSSTRSSIPPCI